MVVKFSSFSRARENYAHEHNLDVVPSCLSQLTAAARGEEICGVCTRGGWRFAWGLNSRLNPTGQSPSFQPPPTWKRRRLYRTHSSTISRSWLCQSATYEHMYLSLGRVKTRGLPSVRPPPVSPRCAMCTQECCNAHKHVHALVASLLIRKSIRCSASLSLSVSLAVWVFVCVLLVAVAPLIRGRSEAVWPQSSSDSSSPAKVRLSLFLSDPANSTSGKRSSE